MRPVPFWKVRKLLLAGRTPGAAGLRRDGDRSGCSPATETLVAAGLIE